MEKLRLRRRLLREVVKENINVIQGHRPRSLRSSHRFLRTPSWTWQWVVISLSLLGSSYVISTIAADRRQVTPPVPPVSSAAAMHPPSLAANVAVSRGATFPAPQPIDPAVLPLGIHKIVVDPGHGGSDFGTIAPLGIVEKDVTLDIGLRLRHLLQKNSFRVSMTRETDKAVSLKERARFANAAGGDLFVSIHVNWIKSRKIRGVETYYLGSTDDPFLTRLAAMENNESGYSLADFRRLLEGIYMDVRQDESRKLAWAVQRELFWSLRKINPTLKNRGVKMAPFIVLVGTEMPAILTEVSCLSNDAEAQLLANADYRQYIARALFRAIHSYARSPVRVETIGG